MCLQHVYLMSVTDDQPYHSTNEGWSWSPVMLPSYQEPIVHIDVDDYHPGTVRAQRPPGVRVGGYGE